MRSIYSEFVNFWHWSVKYISFLKSDGLIMRKDANSMEWSVLGGSFCGFGLFCGNLMWDIFQS